MLLPRLVNRPAIPTYDTDDLKVLNDACMAKVDENNYKKVIASTNDGLKRENEEDQGSLNYTLINRLITDAKETA